MAINIPEYQSVYSTSSVQNAYAWLSAITVDLRRKFGSFKLDVHPSINDWESTPVGQITINLGDSGDGETVKTLDELLQIPEFRQAFDVIGSILYQESLKHPVLKNANITEI